MSKACIFTFHNVPNYGAVLQTYALSEYVERELGYHVDVMDFQCKGNGAEFEPSVYIKASYRSRSVLAALYKKMALSLYFEKDYKNKYRKFQVFKRNFLSEIPYNRDYSYDAVLLGSDQIWNPDITGGFQPEFFGQSKLVNSRIKVAYAASCGDIAQLTESQRGELIERVKNLDYVGVRERSLSEFLETNGIENLRTLDPTFLLSAEAYNMLVLDRPKGANSYLLVYELQKNETLEQLAFEIAREKKLDVRILVGYVSYAKKKTFEIRDAGPIDFLSLVKNADYILTNSFHGTAFSLIYRKDFNVVLPKTRKSRVVDLLSEIGLVDRIVEMGKSESHCGSVNYGIADSKIKKIEMASKNFLNEALAPRPEFRGL